MKYIRLLLAILVVFIALIPSLEAQRNKPFGVPNLIRYDNKLMHFGFLVGYNQMDFAITTKPDFQEYDSLLIVDTKPLSGFNLGIVADLRIWKYFNLRFIPTLTFGDRIVNYTIRYSDGTELVTDKNTESVYIDFPLMMKFKTSRMHNVRVYVLAGAQYSLDLISSAKKQDANPREVILKLFPNDFQAIGGVGIDFYCTYFKFSTEFRMNFGLVNLLKDENNMYTSSISQLKSKNFQISFIFE